ncbi:MAG: hypothetical protein J6T51_03865 [Kiritimatiellae bacterium]|nr:hypothetical protein [Kiritimatiellia bacterium]
MTNYDFAFSMGFGCGCSRALRAAGLQRASFPMDWTGSPGVVASAEMVASGFAGWLERGDLELVDVRRAPANGTINRSYRNRRTGFVFGHDFHHDADIDTAFGEVAEKYARRIGRLMSQIRASRRVLAVFVEHPVRPRAPDGEVARARRILSDAFPGVDFTLLYVYHDDGAAEPAEKLAEPGVVTLGARIRIVEFGLVSHVFDREPLVKYLAARATVPDRRTDEERRAFREKIEAKMAQRLGRGGPLARWWTRLQYRVHRRLEHSLRAKGILPVERPFWF